MFSLSHFSIFFLIRSESRAPCQKEVKRRLQLKAQQLRNESLWYQWKRDKSTWYHAARGARNSSQNLEYLVNPVSADERNEVETATRKPMQTASKTEVGYSQVSRQENALMAEGTLCMEQTPKTKWSERTFNFTSSGQPVQGATPRIESQNMKCTNHQYMTKIFQFQQKKLVITANYSIFLNGSI